MHCIIPPRHNNPDGGLKGGPGGPKLKTKFKKFKTNRARGSGRVGRDDDFPPPTWGYPLVRAGGVRQGQNFRMAKKTI